MTRSADDTAGVFFTGTDTGVGKTFIAAGLAALLKSRGLDVGVIKPIETGCEGAPGSLVPSDGLILAAAVGIPDPLDDIAPFRFARSLAPLAAAEEVGEAMDYSSILAACRKIIDRHAFTIVEGAGGVLVPIVRGRFNADLIRDLGLPCIVVAANRLGCINHTLLTLEALKARSIPIAAVILNEPVGSPDAVPAECASAPDMSRNAQDIASLTDVPVLGSVPTMDLALSPGDLGGLAAHLASHLDMDLLIERLGMAGRV